jgi:hypothetical protein
VISSPFGSLNVIVSFFSMVTSSTPERKNVIVSASGVAVGSGVRVGARVSVGKITVRVGDGGRVAGNGTAGLSDEAVQAARREMSKTKEMNFGNMAEPPANFKGDSHFVSDFT